LFAVSAIDGIVRKLKSEHRLREFVELGVGSSHVNASPDQVEHATLKIHGGFIHAYPESVRGWFSANSVGIMAGVKPIVKRMAFAPLRELPFMLQSRYVGNCD
jgi:hypothetical protein